MKCDCHVHIFMDGLNYQKARARHLPEVDDGCICRHFEEYREKNITFVRDGGDCLGVSLRAKELAKAYGITYRTPIFAIHRRGYYGSIVGRAFENLKEYEVLVKEVRRLGGSFIKIMTTGIMDFSQAGRITGERLESAEVREMVHIAHEEGFAVMAHTNGADAVREAAMAGVDSLEHGNFQDEDSLQAMKDSGTVWVPTLVTVRNLRGKGRFPEAEIEKIMKTQAWSVKKAYEYGVKMASGTDAGAWMVFHGKALEEEYQAFGEILEDRETAEKCLDEGNRLIVKRF
ncbi:MAG: amidohydrolase family protein [Ruminococcus sp.]|jgi:hypothetical protein